MTDISKTIWLKEQTCNEQRKGTHPSFSTLPTTESYPAFNIGLGKIMCYSVSYVSEPQSHDDKKTG